MIATISTTTRSTTHVTIRSVLSDHTFRPSGSANELAA
jgi:hypothetical protein